jgi:DNA-binding transcriptional LysR family regulator
MDLDAVRVFVKVVQAGSFSQAARQLGMPNSTVSARVAQLERQLGVGLLQRTTRRLRLTEAGESYFRRASRAVEEIFSAEAQVSSTHSDPQGSLRITAPIDMASDCFANLISEIRKAHPKISVEFVFTDEVVDLIAQGMDIAIRAGHLKDSRLVARRVGTACWTPFASPSYLRKAGTPIHPRELRNHALVQFTRMGREHWRLSRGKHLVSVPLPHQVMVNDFTLVKSLAMSGNGIALLPTYACRTELGLGTLVRVLPEWVGKADPVHVVYPAQKFVPAKVRAFADLAADRLKQVFQNNEGGELPTV